MTSSACYPRPSAAPLLLLILFALGILSQPASAQRPEPLTLSWRVGPTIDSLEREYFGLFPRVDGFRRATAGAAGADVMITIERADRSDSVVTLSRESFAELGRFVDNIERVLQGATPVDWTKMPAVRTSQPYGTGDAVDVETREGVSITGRLATVDDRGISIWRGAQPYDPARLRTDLVVLPVSQIDRLQSGSSFFIGAAIGASATGALAGYAHTMGQEPPISLRDVAVSTVIGGLIGGVVFSLGDVPPSIEGNPLLYTEVPQRLQGHQMFFATAPPELRSHVDSILDASRAAPSIAAASEPALIALTQPLESSDHIGVNLSVGLGPTFAVAGSSYPVTMSFNRKGDGALATGSFAWRVEGSYEISSHLALAAGVVVRNAFRSDTTINAEWTNSVESLAVLELNLTPYGPIRRRHVEVTTGIGAGLMSLRHSGQLPSGTGGSRRMTESKHSTPMGLGRIDIVLNSSGRLAFYSGIEARIVPPVTIPYYAYRDNPAPEWRYKWVDEHDINLTSVELQFGARIRF